MPAVEAATVRLAPAKSASINFSCFGVIWAGSFWDIVMTSWDTEPISERIAAAAPETRERLIAGLHAPLHLFSPQAVRTALECVECPPCSLPRSACLGFPGCARVELSLLLAGITRNFLLHEIVVEFLLGSCSLVI